ncbi:MAG: hypothetical protein LPK03_06470 [Pontibacter sp.]|nr:hypothetical protein [Pontibacter sp.]
MTKLYTLLAGLVLLCIYPSLAQTPFSTVAMPASNVSRIMAATNGEGDVCLVTFNTEATQFTIVDKHGQAVSSGKYPFNFSSGSTMLGAIGLPDKFILFDQIQDGLTSLQPYKLDRGTGKVYALNTVQAVPDEKSKLVKTFSTNGRFYALYMNKKSGTLYLSIFKDEHEPEVRTYVLDDKRMYERLLRNGELQVMEPGLDQNMHSNHYINKIYTYPDKLVLTFDLFENQDAPQRARTTEILTLDLQQDKASFTKLPYLLDMKGLTFNSYLHQNKLYRFIITKKDLQLEVYDLATEKILKHYYYSENDSIGIMTAGVFRVGTANSWSPHPDTLQTTSKVLRKMGYGYPAIAVDALDDNRLQLTIGTYQIQQSKNSTIAGGVGRGIASAAGPAALPLMMVGMALQATSYALADGAGVSTYFQSVLSADTQEALHGSPRTSLQEKIREYETLLSVQKVKMGGALLYTYQGQVHYAYLDKKQQQLVITSFSK